MPGSRSSGRQSGCCPMPFSPVAPMFWAASGLLSRIPSSTYWPRVGRAIISSAARLRSLCSRAGPRSSILELHSLEQLLFNADSGRRFVPQPSSCFRPLLILTALLFGAGLALRGLPSAAESALSIPPPALDEPADPQARSEGVAILAGGCFWGVQGVFQHVEGVTGAVSGYAGATAKTANYEVVATNKTGQGEGVGVTFDPRRISYGSILQIYFSVAHDPTELNRQGPDVGTQYRS